MPNIAKYRAGTVMVILGSLIVGIVVPASDWITTEIARFFTIPSFVLLSWGVVLIIKGYRSGESLGQKVDRLANSVNQPNKDNRITGITETAEGESTLLTPIDEPIITGDVSRGSKQTFTGIDLDGTVFIKIPELGYAAVTPIIGNDEVEVDFKFDIKKPSLSPTILTVTIGKIYFTQYIPAREKGFFAQKSKARLNKQIRGELLDMVLEIDTGIV